MLLAIETAHSACSVALIDRATVIASRHEEIGRGHAERLVPMVADVLAASEVARAERIVVDIGPGSFTGVRVGLAAARAFGLAWACPVEGIAGDTLVARSAFARADAPEQVLIVLDALRGEVFARLWARSGPCGPIEAVSPEVAADRARSVGAAAGGGVRLLAYPPGWTDRSGPDAVAARLLAPGDLVAPRPLYIRAPDAKPNA